MTTGARGSIPAGCQATAQWLGARETCLELRERALESAHALAGARTIGAELGPDATVLVSLSGRGDKDVNTAAAYFGLLGGEGEQSR